MAVGFPVKDDYATGDVLTAANMNDFAGTLNTVPNSYGMAAGKNALINGAFDIWQRGTSFAGNPSQACADRWFAGRSSVAGSTFSRQTSDLNGFNYKMRVQRDSGNSSTSSIFLNQSVENLNSAPFIDRPVTLSFYAKAGANYSAASSGLAVSILSGTGTDQNQMLVAITGQATVASSTVTLTTSWQRFQITGTSASSAKQLFASFTFTPVGTAGASDFYEITGVQLEASSVATNFSRVGGTIQGELAACQRYFYRMGGDSVNDRAFGAGVMISTTIGSHFIQFPVTMRTAPSGSLSAAGTFYLYGGGGAAVPTAITLSKSTTQSASIDATRAATTINLSSYLQALGTANAFIDISAEL